jgi:AAA domain
VDVVTPEEILAQHGSFVEMGGPSRRFTVVPDAPPPPSGEADYGACPLQHPFDDAAPEGEPSEPVDRTAGGKPSPIKFTPTPFIWRDPSTFPRRQFVYGRHYARQFLSVTAAQTKVGKSSLGLVEAVAMATGQNLLGIEPVRPMRVWYWNGEDPLEELERRVLAICLHYGVDQREVEKNLFLDSGRDTEIIVATQTKTGAVIATPVEDALTAALIDGKFDAFILDPAVSVHRVSENDNMMIDAVAKTFGRIAGRANVAIEAISHTRKLGGAAATIEDSRGASAWTSAARDVRVLNRMTKDEGAKAGIEDGKERLYFRADTDGNLAPSSATEWFHLASQGLGNGSGGHVDDQDYVGVAIPWKWPDTFEGVAVTDLRKVQAAIENGRWRESAQAKDWAGIAVARVLNLDPKTKAHRAKIASLLKTWIANGMFVVVEDEDDKRMKRKFIEVGTPAND